MNDTAREFKRWLGHAALKLWPDLPEMCRNYFRGSGTHRSRNSKWFSNISSRASSITSVRTPWQERHIRLSRLSWHNGHPNLRTEHFFRLSAMGRMERSTVLLSSSDVAFTLKAPAGASGTQHLISGRQLRVPADGIVSVSPEDSGPFLAAARLQLGQDWTRTRLPYQRARTGRGWLRLAPIRPFTPALGASAPSKGR
jgi:hypothetical protein